MAFSLGHRIVSAKCRGPRKNRGLDGCRQASGNTEHSVRDSQTIPSEKFLLMILGSQAKLENDNRGINVKRGLRTRAEMGLWAGMAPSDI